MGELIAEILPFAFGVFASPLPVIVAILMLFTARPRVTSLAYVATWVAGVTAVTVVFTLLAGVLEQRDQPPGWFTWLRVALGLLLLVTAVRQWLGRSAKDAPDWLAKITQAEPAQAARFGLVMSAGNPKELLMALPAGLAVGSSDVGVPAAAGAIAVFVAVGAASVALPVLVFLLGGQSSLERLTLARDALQRHNAAVTSVVLGVLGLWLLVGGLVKLMA